MAEEVSTGGLKKFIYSGEHSELDEERKNDINRGYEEYAIRKKRERRNRIIIFVVIGLIILAGIGYLMLR